MFAYLIIAAALPAFILAQHPIIACPGHADVVPMALRIPGCDSSPCHVGHGTVIPFHGHSLYYEVDFVAHFNSDTLSLSAYETVFGVETQVGLTEELINACNGLIGSSCPIQANQLITHGATIPGEGDLHDGIPVQLRVQITDDDHVCMCTLINLIVH